MNNVWIQDLTPWVVVGAVLCAGCAAVTRDTLPNTSAIKAGMGGDDVVAAGQTSVELREISRAGVAVLLD